MQKNYYSPTLRGMPFYRFAFGVLALLATISAMVILGGCATSQGAGSLANSIGLVNSVSLANSGADSTQSIEAFLESNGFSRIQTNEPIIHYSAESWKASLLNTIAQAKKSVFVLVFLANRNEFNAEIYDALIAKAAEGVPVYFLFDATSYERVFHNPKWNDEIVAPSEVFRGTKVKWAEFNPLRLERIAALPWLLVRDHRKIVMVDGEIIYAGGYNLNIFSFAPLDQNGNEDAMVEIQSPDAGRALAPSLAETWNQFSVESLNLEDIAPAVATGAGGSIGATAAASPEASAGSQTASTDSTTSQDTPLACPPNANKGAVNAWLGNQVIGETRSIEALYRAIFDYAQEEVWLVQAFAMPTETIMQMVKQALLRGIQVNIMLSEDQISPAMDKAVHYTVLPLLEAGAHVFIYKSAGNALLHYKLAMMDRKIVALGSPNFNYRSVRLSNEIVFVFDNERTIGVVSQNLSELQKRARPVSIEEAQKWRGFSYFMSYLLSVPGG